MTSTCAKRSPSSGPFYEGRFALTCLCRDSVNLDRQLSSRYDWGRTTQNLIVSYKTCLGESWSEGVICLSLGGLKASKGAMAADEEMPDANANGDLEQTQDALPPPAMLPPPSGPPAGNCTFCTSTCPPTRCKVVTPCALTDLERHYKARQKHAHVHDAKTLNAACLRGR